MAGAPEPRGGPWPEVVSASCSADRVGRLAPEREPRRDTLWRVTQTVTYVFAIS